jgi:hypothetical protein
VSPFALLFSVKGTINTSGNGSFVFPTARAYSYYIVIKHRNALETWSASPVLLNAATISYDFTTAANKAYGSNQKSLSGGVFGIYSGDVDHDGSISISDFSSVESKAGLFTSGYTVEDITGNLFVESADLSVVENNIGKALAKP